MELLKERIRKDGVVKEGNVLKVDRFLNHQMDVKLFREIGKEFKKRFEGEVYFPYVLPPESQHIMQHLMKFQLRFLLQPRSPFHNQKHLHFPQE